VLCQTVKSPTMIEEKPLIVVPSSLHLQFLRIAHDQAGHQGAERTLSQLSQLAYWVVWAKMCQNIAPFIPNVSTPSTPVAVQHPFNQ